jgi:hypothetical protein
MPQPKHHLSEIAGDGRKNLEPGPETLKGYLFRRVLIGGRKRRILCL